MKEILKNTFYQLKLFRLYYRVNSVVFTQSPKIIKHCQGLGITTQPVPRTNEYGMPELKSMVMEARKVFDSDYVIYINSDILINPDVFRAIYHIRSLLGDNVTCSSKA